MGRTRTLATVSLVLCLGALTAGCEWALSVRHKLEPEEERARIQVLVERASRPRDGNGVTVKAATAPGPITIKVKPGLQCRNPVVERIGANRYLYTFTCTVDGPTQYTIDPNAAVYRYWGKGLGPYVLDVNGPYLEGRRLAVRYRSKELPGYRLAIALRRWSLRDHREEFLRGFAQAYADASDAALGQEYADILRESTECGTFEPAFQEGRRHVGDEVSNAHVQRMIRRNHSRSRGCDLGWKAGYIQGFVEAMSAKTGSNREALYQQAETMYNVLSPLAGR